MSRRSIPVRAVKVTQPIGEFYLGVIRYADLIEVSSVDMRRIEGDLDRYVGIQRKLSKDRVVEIGSFVNSIDATFPASVVLAVKGECATYREEAGVLLLHEGIDEDTGEQIPLTGVANILDGQHRVEGLKAFSGTDFDVPVSIFVNADIADQAYIFATVNLAQTKVNRSLVYDLLDYATARSPQRSCHDIAVALDKAEISPLKGMIKRLGTATPGRQGETLAQATVVGALLPMISLKPEEDRYRLAKGKSVKVDEFPYASTPFRPLWVAERDSDIARVLIEFFSAVRERWPDAWASREKGDILPRTNGFRALMRFLKLAYLSFKPTPDLQSPVVTRDAYLELFRRIDFESNRFSTEVYAPGTSGETALFKDLRASARL
jgi:DGQHR domain-containing protein